MLTGALISVHQKKPSWQITLATRVCSELSEGNQGVLHERTPDP